MKNIIILGVVIVAVLIGGYIWWNNKQAEDLSQDTMYRTNDGADVNPDLETTAPSDTPNSFASLFNSSDAKKCTYSYSNDDEQTNVSGEVYVANGNMLSNYIITQNGPAVSGSMIQNGNTMYIWGSTMPEGIKMTYNLQEAMENAENSTNPGAAQNQLPVDPNMEMDFDCQSWTADDSMFNPPSDVTFRDMSAAVESIGDPNMDNRCAMCDSLQGDDKQACREQLGC